MISTDLTQSALIKLKSFEDTDMKDRAQRVLQVFCKQLIDSQEIGVPIDVFEGYDSISIEWIFDEFRIGIGIETDERESGWYLVSSKDAGGIDAIGSLVDVDLAVLINWLILFVKHIKEES